MNKKNNSIFEYFSIQIIALLALLMLFVVNWIPFSRTRWAYISGVVTKQEHGMLTIKQDHPKYLGDLCLDKYMYLHYDINENVKCNAGDSVAAYYVNIKEVTYYNRIIKEHELRYNLIVELNVNNKRVLTYTWWKYHKKYFWGFIIILLTVIIQYIIMYYVNLNLYRSGKNTNIFFIEKFKKNKISRGIWTKIPNTDITANLIRSEKNKYMVFDYDDALILSTTKWNGSDMAYYNFKFYYHELNDKTIDEVRKRMDLQKYKERLINIEQNINNEN